MRAISSLGVKGLGHIIVGAQLQADDLVVVLHAGGEHDDGHGRQARIAAHHSGHVLAVAVRQHQVQDHQVGLLPAKDVQGRLAVVGDQYLIAALLQVGARQPDDLPVVIYYKDPLRHQLLPPCNAIQNCSCVPLPSCAAVALRQRHRHRQLFAVAQDGQLHRVADGRLGLQVDRQILQVVDRLAVHGHDDVAAHRQLVAAHAQILASTPNARPGRPDRRAVASSTNTPESAPTSTPYWRSVATVEERQRQRLYAQPGMGIVPSRDQLGHHPLHGVGRHGKADARRRAAGADDLRVDADDAAAAGPASGRPSCRG